MGIFLQPENLSWKESQKVRGLTNEDRTIPPPKLSVEQGSEEGFNFSFSPFETTTKVRISPGLTNWHLNDFGSSQTKPPLIPEVLRVQFEPRDDAE